MRHDPAARNIDDRHDGLGKGQQHRFAACRRRHFDQVAGAEILDRDHPTERGSRGVHHGKPDEVGVIVFVGGVESGQSRARHEEVDIVEPLRRRAVGDALQPRDEKSLAWPQRRDLEHAPVLALERTELRDGRRVGGERPQPDFAARSVRRADAADADALLFVSHQAILRERAPENPMERVSPLILPR